MFHAKPLNTAPHATAPATASAPNPAEAEDFLLSLVPDTMDALRLARWHGWLPDLDRLEADLRALQPPGAPRPRRLSAAAACPDHLAARLTPAALAALRRQYGASVRIDPDIAFSHQARAMGTRGEPAPLPAPAPHDVAASGAAALHIRLTDPDGAPIAGAAIRAEGAGLSADAFGAPRDGALEAMGLDLAPLLTVAGAQRVTVAVLHPGAAPTPFGLEAVESGALVEGWSPAGAPPSPAATLIAAAAPGVHLLQLAMGPAPRASDLIAAVDRCLAEGVDLLDLGFAGPAPCAALRAALARARAQGMVVVAPAGDTGGARLWPAAGPEVLAVGAMRAPGACPADAPGVAEVSALAGFSARDGLDVVAPGSGLVLDAPGGPVALDGTALSAACVTGFLARILQTDPDLATAPRSRRRAEALLAELYGRCRDAGLPAGTGGAGLPVWDPLPMHGAAEAPCPSPAASGQHTPPATASQPA